MRVAFPVTENRGMDSELNEHFGRAPDYLVVETDTEEAVSLSGGLPGHGSRGATAVDILTGAGVDALVLKGIGRRAVSRFEDLGIKLYYSRPGSVGENLKALKKGELEEVDYDSACGGKH